MVDATLYGSILRILEWTIAGQDRLGITRGREGNRMANSAPLDNYPTADGTYVCIVAGSDTNFRRLCAAMGRPELADDPQWATLAQRAARSDEINDLVAAWTSGRTAAEIEAACIAHEVPVATAYTRRRHPRRPPHGSPRRPGRRWTTRWPGRTASRHRSPGSTDDRPIAPRPAPLLGEHNDEVWRGPGRTRRPTSSTGAGPTA